MSLYGLDIIVDREGKKYLNEINGILSGMRGFEQIYGDNRVEKQVFDMLQAKYGDLTINDGTYGRNQFKKNHPFLFALGYVLLRTPLIRRIFLIPDSTLSSKKAEIDWLNERVDNSKKIELPFESYNGQESTVINIWNEELPHPSVNPLIAEGISRNKFLQYLVLRDSEIAQTVIDSSLVGLGATNEEELEKMISNYDSFVVKPVLGLCGRGVKFLTKKEANEKYNYSRGPLDYVGPFEFLFESNKKNPRVKYIEDLIDQNDFSFEPGVSIIQPFIDSRKVYDGEEVYSVIRAIICNGTFVDAYLRVSKNPRVNLSQDAKAISFDYDSDFAGFCEKVIEVFEGLAQEYTFDSYKSILYQKYIDERGRTSDFERKSDINSPLVDAIFSMIKHKYFGP